MTTYMIEAYFPISKNIDAQALPGLLTYIESNPTAVCLTLEFEGLEKAGEAFDVLSKSGIVCKRPTIYSD